MSSKKRQILGALTAVGLFFTGTLAGCDEKPAGDEQATAIDDPWYQNGEATLDDRLSLEPNTKKAKNVIVFISDGLGVTAAAAARIYDGQQKGMSGEENYLAWERFPYSALAKTYTTDAQIPDSAATASAIATGIKTNNGAVSVPANVTVDNCAAPAGGYPATLAEKAADLGKATGVVTTTIITDATPASQFGHSPSRRWWNPVDIPEDAQALGCQDLALQLLESDIDVALGGGRINFTPTDLEDPERAETFGVRPDGRNLTEEWLAGRTGAAYVQSREELMDLDRQNLHSLLGLFNYGSMVFGDEAPEDGMTNPTLAEMTEAALDVLTRDEDGFFLLVEHEGTDDLQHGGTARKAFDAVREISEAVEVALQKVDLSETLIVFTSDHGQAIVFSGSSPKGNPILGFARGEDGELSLADDGKPYTTIGFYAGPGAFEGERPDLSEVDTASPDFTQQALLPGYVPHTGDDVPVYANGPWAHLFGGLIEQNAIHHLIMHAMDPDAKGK